MIRKLNQNELRILKSLYFNEVNYDKVKISNQHIFSKILKRYSAIVFDNTIIFTRKNFKDDFSKTKSDMALLVHEICHVWQYQNLSYRWYKAGFEHLKYRKETYKYNINDNRKLINFRFEQQGEILADYYRKKLYLSSETSVYEDVIYSIIKKTN